VLLNLGGGYSAVDGEFTAPTSGLYHISYRGWTNTHEYCFVHLQLNGNRISELPVGDEDHESASSQSVVAHLNHGDILYLKVSFGSHVLRGGSRTTFMGYLLKAD
jgi:hypothetical protein